MGSESPSLYVNFISFDIEEKNTKVQTWFSDNDVLFSQLYNKRHQVHVIQMVFGFKWSSSFSTSSQEYKVASLWI